MLAMPPDELPPLPKLDDQDGDRAMVLEVWERLMRDAHGRGAWAPAIRALQLWQELALGEGTSVTGLTSEAIDILLGR